MDDQARPVQVGLTHDSTLSSLNNFTILSYSRLPAFIPCLEPALSSFFSYFFFL